MRHLLLCGHGYLGQAISRDFLAAGWQVRAASRHLPESPSSTPGLSEHIADLSSDEDLHQLKRSGGMPDFIVHCASSGRGGADAYRAVYLQGCLNLLAIFPGVPLLFTSSTSVYAQTDGSVVTEESPAIPDRETGSILRETEELVLSNGGIITRLSGIYGPGRSAILKKFLSGEAVIEEDGRRFLNQIHRDDAAAAILHLALLQSTIDKRQSAIGFSSTSPTRSPSASSRPTKASAKPSTAPSPPPARAIPTANAAGPTSRSRTRNSAPPAGPRVSLPSSMRRKASHRPSEHLPGHGKAGGGGLHEAVSRRPSAKALAVGPALSIPLASVGRLAFNL